MGFLRLGSKKAKKDTTATLSPSFSSPDPLHIKLNKDDPPLLSSPIADNFMSIPTENQQDPHDGTIGKSLYEDIFSELNPSSSSTMSPCEYLSLHQVYDVFTDNRVYTAKAPEEQQIMRESVEEASSIAESSSTSKGGVKVHSSAAAVSLPPAATITSTTTISPTKQTPRPTRRRMLQHRSSVPDSDASDSDASSSSTAITSDSVGSLKAFDHTTTKHKITPETLLARMRERHRQECRKSWIPSSPTAATEQHHKPASGAGFYRTASPSMPVMYPPNPMMLPLAHESMQHQHIHPGIVRSASTFSGFYHPLDHHQQPHPSLQLRPLNNQSLPVRAIPPMSPPLSPISPMSSPPPQPPVTSIPQQQPIIAAQQDHRPLLLLKQPSSSPPLSKRHHNEDDGDDQNQDASLKQPIQEDTPADQGDTTTPFLVDRDVQTDEDYRKSDESMTPPPPNMEEDSKIIPPSSLQSHEDNLKNDNGGSGVGVRQVVPLGETMPVVLVSESETGTKQYYLLLPQQYGEQLQQELQQQRQQQTSSPQSSCCRHAEISSCNQDSSCSHQRHHRHQHHHHHHCRNHRRSSSPPSNNHCSQHRRHHHCCRRPTTGSGSSRADSIISSAQRSSV
ncbi:predicted protein [Lichtheimia corymbifera JMRC:FSU:9682]|uniref:Uncharacterized protein n=1 Tax=Lichtheimia corymbifera JMRC:FSU:9682 TaxID=1263082 RepID=A0A068RW64_9FUNG|nr:predicted protein [Lichtheimia corymbifera JMRC:FSU:9682]